MAQSEIVQIGVITGCVVIRNNQEDALTEHNETAMPAETALASFAHMRNVVATADALISAAQCLYEHTAWGSEVDAVRRERIALLLDAACDAAENAILAVDKHHSLFLEGCLV